jgi:GT2 family glycosyltransferase
MDKQYHISVGLLSYKRTDLLKETIKSFVDTSFEVELVLLNNNVSSIYEEISDFLPSKSNLTLNYLSYGKNLGVSEGRRKIVENCNSDILIILDDDVEVKGFDNIVERVLGEFHCDSNLGAAAFNIKEYSTGKNNHYEIPHKDKTVDLSEDFYTYLIIGAGNAINVKVAREVGNFADDFGLYGFEEIDLAFRIIASGRKIKYLSDCVILHKKSPDGRFHGELVNQLYFENRTRMAKRYLKAKYYFSCLIVRFFYMLVKTRNITLCVSSLRKVLRDDKNLKFDDRFYDYIRDVRGFLWF